MGLAHRVARQRIERVSISSFNMVRLSVGPQRSARERTKVANEQPPEQPPESRVDIRANPQLAMSAPDDGFANS